MTLIAKPYKVELPERYQEMQRLGNDITAEILQRRIPQSAHIEFILGSDAVPSYFLMHALMREAEHRQGILIPLRRDGMAIQRHSYDAAFRPFNRVFDKKIPSRYFPTSREKKGILIHDVEEEAGRSMLQALVLNDIIGHILGREIGRDSGLLTNYSNLLYRAHKEEIIHMGGGEEAVKASLARGLQDFRVEPGSVLAAYKRVADDLAVFGEYVRTSTHYMPEQQRERLVGLIGDLRKDVLARIDGGILSEEQAARHIKEQYAHMLKILEKKDYVSIGQRLLLPGEPEFLAVFKQTLYRDFIRRNANAVRDDARLVAASSNPLDDSYLAPFIDKLAESTDTAANLETKIKNARDVSIKLFNLTGEGVDLVGDLQGSNNVQRLPLAIRYLFDIWKDAIQDAGAHYERREPKEKANKSPLVTIAAIKEDIRTLERRIEEIEPSWTRDALRVLREATSRAHIW